MTASLLFRLSDNHPLCEEDDYHWKSLSFEIQLNELKMLLMSCSRLPGIENIPLVNASILNYGIDTSFRKMNDMNSRRETLKTCLKTVIARFEPRLDKVTITDNSDCTHSIKFVLHGIFVSTPIALKLTWNDCIERFDFNE
ncbi:GPW/gp25 family protein [Buttiauxella sp. S19-1]|uniref:GPW/gp25 family protein n=1 Tax=Buttiauxella sp. S19-1 TaxID=941430 RepID=UPI001EDC6D2F|nr:GPW/gp25 family protein [Buttiauxella sp. S19-1]